MEIWKPVPSWPYQVSNLGNVINQDGRPIKPIMTGNGYCTVVLRNGPGTRRRFYVHRLVLELFVGSQPDKQADHINMVRTDNRLRNLRWLTKAENLARRVPLRGERHNMAKLNNQNVSIIRDCLLKKSNTELAKQFGVNRRTIADIRNGVTWND